MNTLSKYMQAYCLVKAITRAPSLSNDERLKRLFFLNEKSKVLEPDEFLAIHYLVDAAMSKLTRSN